MKKWGEIVVGYSYREPGTARGDEPWQFGGLFLRIHPNDSRIDDIRVLQ